jgi:hypothetical protein
MKVEDLYPTPVAGSRCRNPTSGQARVDMRGSQPEPTPSTEIKTDQVQGILNQNKEVKEPERGCNPAVYSTLCIQDLYRPDDCGELIHDPTWGDKEGYE